MSGKMSKKQRARLVKVTEDRLRHFQDKAQLGVLQALVALKECGIATRVSVCYEILFKIRNPNYDQYGKYIGISGRDLGRSKIMQMNANLIEEENVEFIK